MARQRPWLPVGVAVVAAAGIALLALTWPDGDSDEGEGMTTESTVDLDLPVAIDSPATGDPADLADLVAASDLVVVATVDEVARGRPVDPTGTASEESAFVTLNVEEVLAGDDQDAQVVVEEEGWMADGRRIAMDGAAPTEVGDRAIWFLVDVGGEGAATWVTVGRVGRWVERGGVLSGPLLDIPLAIDLQDRPLDDVVADMRGLSQ